MSGSDVVALPSRSKGRPHVLTITNRLPRCLTCEAALHGRTCWAVKSMTKRLNKHASLATLDLLTAKEAVYNVLQIYPEARESDLALFRHYFREYEGWDLDALTVTEFFNRLSSKFGGNHLETLRRRRQEIQAVGEWLASEETRAFRDARREAFTEAVLGG